MRSIWVGGLPIAIPKASQVIFPEGERVAIIAVPRRPSVYIITEQQTVIPVPDEREAEMVRTYFGEATAT